MDDGIPIADKQENDGTKRRIKINPFLASYLFFVALMALIVFYNPYSGGCPVVTVGFVKIQPLMPAISYRNTNFNASFTNTFGTAINLTGITINETISGTLCNPVTSSPEIFSLVKAGGTITVTGVCPQKADGEAYDMVVTISYNATLSGITTNHTDTGHIKGQGEAY
jgi:hypothetical protein